mmetsp:Transcript_58048/g.187916  ORF Transcript_58048/g.187916 Transcript_58048/m.187916 type:complete len:87 (+) Transcript_58048:73-333(+)
MTISQSQHAAVQATKGFQHLVGQRLKILAEILAKMSKARARETDDWPLYLDDLHTAQLKCLLADRSLSATRCSAVVIARIHPNAAS